MQESQQQDPTDEISNPIVTLFSEKAKEYWFHIKETIDLAFTKRIEKAKKMAKLGLVEEILVNGIKEERNIVFAHEINHVEKLFLEGLKELEEMK